MKSLRLSFVATGVAALLGGVFLLTAGAVPAVQEEERPVSLAGAEELSKAFRWVAKKTLPAVVSVRSVKKIPAQPGISMRDPLGSPFGGSPLDDLFGDLRERMREQEENGGQEGIATGEGSGFIIAKDGLIMTNAHVVRGADEISVSLQDGREFPATDIRFDEFSDVAVMRISVQEDLPELPLGNDADMQIGDWVMAFGSPFGLDQTVTQGIISAKSRGLKNLPTRQEFLQTDAAINPGNSGGPLVNLRGEVVGINTAIETRSGGYDGVGFAVPISLAKWVGDQLVRDGKVRRAYLGVLPEDLDSGTAKALDLSTTNGVIVKEVTRNSPADKAGVRVQDVIVRLNNRPVRTRQQLITIAERLQIGETYPLVVLRDGKETELQVVAEQFPETVAQAGQQIESLGIEAQTLTPELARQLEIDAESGVVITNVQRNSFAARIGLRPGYVIARVGKTDVTTVEELEDGLKTARERRQLVLLVRTPRGTELVSVPFGG